VTSFTLKNIIQSQFKIKSEQKTDMLASFELHAICAVDFGSEVFKLIDFY